MSEMKNGKVDVMGINVDISQVLGEKIVDQYMAQMTDEDVKKITDYIEADLWTKNYCSGEKIVRKSEKNNWGQTTEVSIGDYIKGKFGDRVKDEIAKKCEEIVTTQDFKDKVEEIAQEIVDYAAEGYKEDIKNRVRQRLVGNVMDAVPMYDDVDLVGAIYNVAQVAISNRLSQC